MRSIWTVLARTEFPLSCHWAEISKRRGIDWAGARPDSLPTMTQQQRRPEGYGDIPFYNAGILTQGMPLPVVDRRTIPLLLKTWGEERRKHGGVIFVDDKTIPQSDSGGLILSLIALSRKTAKWDWTDRICFLLRW